MFAARLAKLAARIPRRTSSDLLDVAGIGCLVGAAWWWQPIIGLVATGVAVLFLGWVIDR